MRTNRRARDVSDARRLEQRLRQDAEELQKTVYEKGEYYRDSGLLQAAADLGKLVGDIVGRYEDREAETDKRSRRARRWVIGVALVAIVAGVVVYRLY